jgi:hypothetical protein
MASLYGFLNSLLNGGEVHDYAHAAQVFRTNNFSRSPKYKFLFYVNFVLGQGVPRYVSAREISYLVKSVDLPKFTVDVKDLNQYNRHVYVQDRIKYEPINIKFHDDNQNGLRELWQDYYNYYYGDGLFDANTYYNDDRYKSQKAENTWGLDNGSTTPFFSSIEIYSMQGGEANKVSLMNPIITSFSHDTHDYAETTSLMEATMQLRYNGVIYEQGYVQDMPGFSENPYYDNTLSGLSGAFGQSYYLNPITGDLQSQGYGFTNRGAVNAQQGSYGFVDQGRQYDNSGQNGFTQDELNAIQAQNKQVNAEFPTAQTATPTIATSINETANSRSVVV